MRKAKMKGKATTSRSKPGKKDNNHTIADTEMAASEPVKVDEGMFETVRDGEEKRVELVDTSEAMKMEEGVPEGIFGDEVKKEMRMEPVKMDEAVPEVICGDEERMEMASAPVKIDNAVPEGIKRELTSEPVKMDGVPEGICGNEEKREMKSLPVKKNEEVPKGICGDEEKKEMTSEPVKMDEGVPETICGGEKKMEVNEKEEGSNEESIDNTLNVKGNELIEEKKAALESGDAVLAKDSDVPGTSIKNKDPKKTGSMGMIFMCSSKTRKDCYHYKVLGMPASKKEMVAKIYKGMRLFVFDIDLKLMYGIYKAAGPGGYKIEPKAFQSAFPSQVRFTVLEDCLPLPEEKFRPVIKDNYYEKKKFDCQLKPEQVKNLCKLFQVTTRERGSKQVGSLESLTFLDRYRERRQVQGASHSAFGAVNQFPEDAAQHERRLLASAASAPQLPAPLRHPLPPYAYERLSGADYHSRDVEFEHCDRRLLEIGLSGREEMVFCDPHMFKGPPQYGESMYPIGLPSHYPPTLNRY